jgi:hypothetical protein
MNKIYLIQDVKTKEYYWQYRIDEGFNANVSEAKEFNSIEDAEKEMQEEYLEELFAERFIEIKCYYKPNGYNEKYMISCRFNAQTYDNR